MAAVAATTATVLLLLFTFSSAHYPLNQPKIDVISSDPSLVTLPDSDPKPGAAILLPSERPESEPATLAEIDPAETQSADSKSQETEQYEVKSESESESETDSLPLTTVFTLRPINRHFSRGSFFPIRRGHKCHGHRRQHNPQFHELRQRFGGQGFNGQREISFGGQGFNGQREISFGNDMIVAKDQDRGFDRSFSSERKGLERWARYNRGGQRLSLTNNGMEEMNGMAHPHIYHHHRHHRHYRHHHAEDGEEEEEHRHENGIIKGIMRFLNL